VEGFSEERFLLKLQRLLGKICYSDNDVHLVLEELRAFPLEIFKRSTLDKIRVLENCCVGEADSAMFLHENVPAPGVGR